MNTATRKCPDCGAPLHNQRMICRRCERYASRMLANQASLRGDLAAEYLRMTRKTEQVRVLDRREFPIPFEAKASRLLARQASWLAGWAAVVVRLRPPLSGPLCRRRCTHRSCIAVRDSQPPAATVEARSCFVEAALPLLRNKPEAPQLLAELRRLVAEILAVVDLPAVRTKINAGPCPLAWAKDDAEEPCPGQVDAVVPADERIPAMMRCSACHAEWDTTRWSTAGRLILARQETLQKQAELAKQFAKTVAA